MLTYTELLRFSTLRDRFNYLRLDGMVGCSTFGSARWMNQMFYRSREWRDMRDYIKLRDDMCDLGVPDHYVPRGAIVHHLNPITEIDILERRPCLLDPENLITVAHNTHNAIHYGDENLLPRELVDRFEGDTKEW